MSQKIGFTAEREARDYLIKNGLVFVTNNYRCRVGEIDLIMNEGNDYIFVEVRARVSEEYGNALESITLSKRKKIMKTAMHFMTQKKLYNKHSARFDVISFQGSEAKICWIKNAFGLDY